VAALAQRGSRLTTVCCFGAWDPAYARNRILRAGLVHAGYRVVEARSRPKRVWRRWPALAASWSRVARETDIVWVPEFRHKDVPLAAALKGRRPLVFDPLVSRWDTLVGDWRLHAAGSGQARWNRGIDRWAFRAADLLLCDTWAHGELFVELGAERTRLRRVLVGAEPAFFAVPPPPMEGLVRVTYVGGFLPLHGVRTLLEAVVLLEARAASLPPFVVQLVGDGIEYEASREFAAAARLTRVEFTGRLAYADAPRILEPTHVALGVFGSGDKAGRVIPHKLWQGLAAGRAVVTGDGAGPREVFEDGVHLRLVPRGDAEALATTLGELIASAEQRARLGAAGQARARELGSVEAVGSQLAHALASMQGGTPE
jgi:glycosyltransferase involved in cell wall biosynthesis